MSDMFKSGIAEDCPGIELDGQSLEIEEKFRYLGNTQLKLEWVHLTMLYQRSGVGGVDSEI